MSRPLLAFFLPLPPQPAQSVVNRTLAKSATMSRRMVPLLRTKGKEPATTRVTGSANLGPAACRPATRLLPCLLASAGAAARRGGGASTRTLLGRASTAANRRRNEHRGNQSNGEQLLHGRTFLSSKQGVHNVQPGAHCTPGHFLQPGARIITITMRRFADYSTKNLPQDVSHALRPANGRFLLVIARECQ